MLASNAVDCGFEPQSSQTKDYEIGICCFLVKHAALIMKQEREKTDWLGIGIMWPSGAHVYPLTVVSLS